MRAFLFVLCYLNLYKIFRYAFCVNSHLKEITGLHIRGFIKVRSNNRAHKLACHDL
ncbi:hypothetical protein PAHA111176_04975 [Parendozoicomonas haliclonae]|uniref:Uncharacterized protein n=1 Tax=Parendozoicomonas haliclonae TaxID=1960125 RepID=A0A1X7AMF5_9GAMM|nr:hypothetical protein EHSB41UT_02357 [Parendozoicomonas haliclonae]